MMSVPYFIEKLAPDIREPAPRSSLAWTGFLLRHTIL